MSNKSSCPLMTSLLLLIVMAWGLTACTTMPTVTTVAALATSTASPAPPTATVQPSLPPVVVAFVKDGDIHLWDEATGENKTVFGFGDVAAVKMSGDGQVIAFLRMERVDLNSSDWYVQFSLWVVDQDGENQRELVSAADLRAWLGVEERDSSDFFQVAWIPGTRRLLFSSTKYLVQAEGRSHASPQGVYQVDAETGSIEVLAPTDQSLRFVPSPDGEHIALISLTGLSFINADGSNWRRDVLSYPDMSLTAPVFPVGVWTQDASAFLITRPVESEARHIINLTLWRVSVDGSAAEPLSSIIEDSHPASVVFSPNGHGAAYYQAAEQNWKVIPLTVDVGPVAIPLDIELGYANLHWSPAGDPIAIHGGTLSRLCPDGTLDTDVCETPIELEEPIAAIRWIDNTRFLILTREPYQLFLGGLDGTKISIVTWRPEEYANPQSFTTRMFPDQR